MLRVAAKDCGVTVEPTYHRSAFPDIKVNGFGVEAKYSKRDTWTTVANSIFESMRDEDVQAIYVMFGKGGGVPAARWARYGDCITHVRTSNAPRFVVDLDPDTETRPLFRRFGIAYNVFARLSDADKMEYVRDYWRGRLKQGEQLWWLEADHSLELNVRLYANLSPDEKRSLRAEAALLCPQVCGSKWTRNKFALPAMYAITQWGVLCPQARDLFSAGSVAEQISPLDDKEPYVSRGLRDIEDSMVEAAMWMPDALFVEYWGRGCPPDERIRTWLAMADAAAKEWKPSDYLFRGAPHEPGSS